MIRKIVLFANSVPTAEIGGRPTASRRGVIIEPAPTPVIATRRPTAKPTRGRSSPYNA
jgi:hypothetical protein